MIEDEVIERLANFSEENGPTRTTGPNSIFDEDTDHPLFWDHMPSNGREHPLLQALQNIENEGTIEEIAENAKHRGNNAFQQGKQKELELKKLGNKGLFAETSTAQPGDDADLRAKLKTARLKYYHQAIEEYTTALQCASKDNHARSIYHSNRAAVHLALGKQHWGTS